jgi:hypothetical protein
MGIHGAARRYGNSGHHRSVIPPQKTEGEHLSLLSGYKRRINLTRRGHFNASLSTMRLSIMIKELRMKKILLVLLTLIVVGVGGLFAINGTSQYDPSKYNLTITPIDEPFGIGSSIDFTLPDQFDQAIELPEDTQKLMFVFTKPTGHIFRSWMAFHDTSDYLRQRKIVAVADVSAMPTVILNTFAMPDFRKSKYSIELIYDKQMAAKLKKGQEVDKVIIMTLQNKKVTKIEDAASVEELNKLFK